jgi:hypothetical protein
MSASYWDPQVETLPVERRRLLRDHRLRWQVRRCWDGSPFYRARLEGAGLDPATFGGLEDLHHVPILRAADLPTGPEPDEANASWTVAPSAWWQETEVLGGGVHRALTDGDIVHRADRSARALWAAGARPNGTVTVLSEPDESVLVGLRRIGARAEVGSATFHFAFPLPPYVTCIVVHTCEADDGLHWADDHFLIEVVDPATGARVSPGEAGAVLVTDLTREGSPFLRLWMGLEAALIDEPCPCGRTSARCRFVRPLP